MKPIVEQLQSFFAQALVSALGEFGRGVDPLIRPSADARFGDYQSNLAMGLARQLKAKPRDLAEQVVAALPPEFAQMCAPCELAGPGFINIRLKPAWMAAALGQTLADAAGRAGVPLTERPSIVVVDYSGPNVAKQMHVGHIRSTILGDCFARVLEFLGHKVIRQNHIGDWGTQFGMLCAYLKEKMPGALENPEQVHLADLEGFYREASTLDKADAGFHERARAEVVALHNREPSTMRAWQYIVAESRRHYLPLYQRLNVSLTQADERGESFYADRLAGVVEGLAGQFGSAPGAALPEGPRISVEVSDGALCVFHTSAAGEPLFKNPEGNPLPLLIRKSDGAFLYATTDLAALSFRIEELGAERIIYVTDARQAQHFEMVFTTARAAGWIKREDREVALEHVTFGSILGEDRKPLKTRSGENVKLADLLDEALERAEALLRANEADPAKRRGFTEEEIHDVAAAVGVGAVKYADLSQNRQTDYLFSWDRMLALEGNTAPYLMYAYARIRSIYRKGPEQGGGLPAGGEGMRLAGGQGMRLAGGQTLRLDEPTERRLGLQLLRFGELVAAVAQSLRPNLLTDYLYELSGNFMSFYEQCPVLRAEDADLRASRLALCELTAQTLETGLGLLGIRVVERM